MTCEPIITTWNDLMFGKVRIDGYVIYAVHDENMRCAYVGMSKNVNNRTCAHIHKNESDVPVLVSRVGNPVVHVYTLECADEFIKASNGGTWNHQKASERNHAHAAEYELCQILRPYLNRRLTYAQDIDLLKKFLFEHTHLGYQEGYFLKQCKRVLHEWGVEQERFDEVMNQCNEFLSKKMNGPIRYRMID